MATNFYFQSGNTSGTTNEQRLIEDLIIESIKIYGHDVYYLPRSSGNLDNILGEDVLSQFDTAIPLEMYLADIQGWEGNGELFTKFGISVTDQATFVVSKRRWEDTVGSSPEELLQLPNRPAEGDLIYLPKTNSMFEIKFVQHLDPFYQLGKFYVYSMNCISIVQKCLIQELQKLIVQLILLHKMFLNMKYYLKPVKDCYHRQAML